MGMRPWFIQTLIVSLAIGWFIFYGQPLVDYVQTTFNLTMESSQLYAVVALAVVVVAELMGKLLTRGMR